MSLHEASETREFFVWVDPNNPDIQHNMGLVGTFASGPAIGLGGGNPEYLQFVHNPNSKPCVISPFHNNVIRDYTVEYNLENARHKHPEFTRYPSRLWALFLLGSRADALRYRETHLDHVGKRVLKRCVTVGPYTFSLHDAAWIKFLRESHMMDADTWSNCMYGYWSGGRADQTDFSSRGKLWVAESAIEALFYGRVDFPNKNPAEQD